METSGCLEEEMLVQDVWKSAVEEHGALSVTTPGITLMLKLYVISWAMQEEVCRHDLTVINSI